MIVSETFTYQDVQGYKFGYHPFGKPSMFSHVYFVDGLLIDTGHSRMRKIISRTLEQLPVKKIFITHHHEDHSGNIEPLKKLYKCSVYSSQLCADIMKDPPKISLAQRAVWGGREAQTELVAQNTSISTPSYTFELIPIPGHAKDMVALYEPHKKWLFSADLYINSYISYFLHDESMADQIDSIRNILDLDFNVMFCGHSPKLENPKTHLSAKLRFLEKFYADVAHLHKQGLSPKEIFQNLQLKENRIIQFFSGGSLSKMNMIRSVISDLKMRLT